VDESSPTPDDIAIRTGSALVEITCPAWCPMSADEHARLLWDNEGRCIHQTEVRVADPRGERVWEEQASSYCSPIELVLRVTTNPVGREVESADVLINGQESNLEQLALLAEAISGLATLYRAMPGRR
jgi:hypothetical protein